MMKQFCAQARIFWYYLKPWWVSEEKVTAWGGLLCLIMLASISVTATWLNNVWTKYFFVSFENKDASSFLYIIALYIPLVLVIGGEGCTREYLSSWLSFRWRRWVTNQVEQQWLTNKLYYKTAAPAAHSINNPDQRIAQDITESCNKIIELFHIFFRDGLNFFVFAGYLWSVSAQLQFAIPGLLVWVALLYSVVGFMITMIIGKRLIPLDRQNEKIEANFRYQLIRLLEKREEIAMLAGEQFEDQKLKITFNDLARNYKQVLQNKFYVNLFNALHYNTRFFVALAILGPFYFTGVSTMSFIMQARGMFNQVSIAASTIMNKFTDIAALIAALQRLTNFELVMKQANQVTDYFSSKGQNLITSDQYKHKQEQFIIEGLKIFYPDKRLMWAVPSIKLNPGERKLLMAPSGTGKTTLLRVIAGLYRFYTISDKQCLTIPTEMVIIPQRPYLPLGTLRECLMYPSNNFTDAVIIKAMEQCQLSHLISYLDQQEDYQQLLSLGEQQRINFARIILHKPKWLLLDEPTSQLNIECIQELCDLLIQLIPETAILAISHHSLPHFERLN